RVSTDEQVANLSLDVQEAACRDLCEREGWPVVAVYREEGASAKTLRRPRLQAMLADLGRRGGGVSRVVVYRVDRLSRDIDHFHVLRHQLAGYGVEVASATESISEGTIDGVVVRTILALTAQLDNMIRSSRARAGMTEAVRRGRWVWRTPLGYRIAPRGADGRSAGIEPDPERADL